MPRPIDMMTPKPTAPAPTASSQRSRKWIFVASGGIVVFVLAGAGAWYWTGHRQAQMPLPAAVIAGSPVAVYYPMPLAAGYAYDSGSAQFDQGLTTYRLHSQAGSVTIAEQAVPAVPPDLGHLKGFTPTTLPTGQAAYGHADARPVVIVLTRSTLVTLTGTPKLTLTDLRALAGALTNVNSLR